MKTLIPYIVTAVVSVLLFSGIQAQNRAYEQSRKYLEDCDKLGGIVTKIESGWVHATLQCSVKPATSTPSI